MSSIWEELSLYESRDLITKLYKEKHNRSLSSEKSHEIVSFVAQGREYFQSARLSAELVRPLLLYYGVLSFSRAIILFLNTNSRANSIATSHGLSAKNWRNVLSKGIAELPNIVIEFTGGTFSELSKVTSNLERSKIYTGPFPSQIKVESINNSVIEGNQINLKQVLSQIQELSELYIYTFNEFSNCYLSSIFTLGKQTDYSIFTTKIGLPEIEDIKRKFNLPSDTQFMRRDSCNFFGNIENLWFRITHPQLDDNYSLDIQVKQGAKGLSYIVSPLSNGLKLSSLSYLFLASFSLGMLVRYYPSHWLSLINRAKGDRVYPLLKATSNLIETKFPQLVLEELNEGTSYYNKNIS